MKICSQCNGEFYCGPTTVTNSCWCNQLPPILQIDESTGCLCKNCLRKIVQQKIEAYTDAITVEQAHKVDLSAYQQAEHVEGIDYYLEGGNYVFTKWYHLKRGHCCNSGCRHCPYGFKSNGVA